ncbi:hypothetical protein Taro_021553 [Colocasia esculenta]|uniref:RRM domain-containing protein n=1 Tax=Colocasia esculenta TaxID=4460 RepID=A0A843UZ49_COLES|nr:hypothetical protein [Colocasia esculenta]
MQDCIHPCSGACAAVPVCNSARPRKLRPLWHGATLSTQLHMRLRVTGHATQHAGAIFSGTRRSLLTVLISLFQRAAKKEKRKKNGRKEKNEEERKGAAVSRAMLGSGNFLDGYEVGSKRPRMMDSNPYFAVSSSSSYPSSYGSGYGSRESSYGVGLSGYGSNVGGGNIYSFPVVRLRGLPFNCTDLDIYRFFTGLDVVDCLLTNKNGRFSGEAFVVFTSPMQAEFALQRDRQNMGRRYVEVFQCKKQDYYHAIANEVTEYRHVSPPPAKKPHDDKDQMEYTEILKLRGLPFSATKSDIIEFFGGFELSEDNVHIALRADGKATGEAYVEFSSAEEAKKAMNKDKMMIGSRYVELFPSTPEEARRAESRSRQSSRFSKSIVRSEEIDRSINPKKLGDVFSLFGPERIRPNTCVKEMTVAGSGRRILQSPEKIRGPGEDRGKPSDV